MKQTVKYLMVVLAMGLLGFLAVNAYWDYLAKYSQPEMITVSSTQSVQVGESTATPFTPEIILATQMPTPTNVPPTATPAPVQNYVLGQTIDLENGGPVVLVLELPDGASLASNWAQPIGYKGTDDASEVFGVGKGTIYSYLGEVTSTWAHSGMYRGQKIFASNLELYLRVKPQGGLRTFEEGQSLMLGLVGQEAYLCQMPDGSVEPMSDFEVAEGCLGKKLTLRVSTAVIVPHEMVPAYDEATMTTKAWLEANIPGAGFERVTAENGWLLKFCVGEFNDQPVDGTPAYLYNRAVIGFVIDP